MKTETTSPLPSPPNPAHIRATAWALDQLSPEETTVFETEMAHDPELAAYAQEMREFSQLLTLEFSTEEDSISLPEASRERVVAALSQPSTFAPQGSIFKRHWKSLSLTTAAAAGIALTLHPDWMRQPKFPIGTGKDGIVLGGETYASVDDVRFKSNVNLVAENSPDVLWSSQPGSIRAKAQSEEKLSKEYRLYSSDSPQKGLWAQASVMDAQAPGMAPVAEAAVAPSSPLSSRFVGLDTVSSDAGFRGTDAVPVGRFREAREWAFPSDYAESTRQHISRNTESYKPLPQNPFHEVTQAPLSTFSIDVDTASYANVRRFLNAGQRPPQEAVRLEELINYFPYEEAQPPDGKPFAVKVEVTSAPWNPAHRLARVALKGKEMATSARPPSNLVFLVDVSGSMNEPNKLPLVQQSLRLLTERLTENDRVSLVTYAGSSGVVLPSTNGQEKGRIQAAIDSLSSGGGTNGAGGITTAYEQAASHFIKDGVNRVILATDGDFNVGASSHEALLALITEKAKTGVFLSVLGYGRGNLKDDTMELLADKGNGNYGYIDSLSEARKTLVEQMSGTLVTIAKDVKIQIEFNPAAVKSYRLLGYENRLLAKEDFNDDKKDAGEIGAGHNVTALYEIIPAGAPDAAPVPVVDGLKYQQVPAVITPKAEPSPAALNGEMMNVKLRWKQPAGDISELLEVPVKDSLVPLDQAGKETRWAAAVAGFSQLLRGNAPPSLTWEMVRQLARNAKGSDALGYRGEFLQLIDKAEGLSRTDAPQSR